MIKRTLGRSLLALLVLTGLAGTINDNSISQKERKFAITLMKDTRSEVSNSVKGLSEAQLNYKASPEKWSVKECVYHIAASEKKIWELMEMSMKNAANPEKRAEIKVSDEQFVKQIEDRSSKVQTMDQLKPENTGYKSLNEALEDFRQQRADHIKYMKSSTEDLRNHVVELPFGWVDCYQLCLMVAAHSNRHLQQINEVKASPGFPKQ